MASDATGLRDVLVGVDREPAVLGITVAQIEHERSQAARYREALEAARAALGLPAPHVALAERIIREALERITGGTRRRRASREAEALGDGGVFEPFVGELGTAPRLFFHPSGRAAGADAVGMSHARQSTTESGRLLTMREAADRLAISKRSAERMVERGELRVVRITRRTVRVRPSDLDAAVDRLADTP